MEIVSVGLTVAPLEIAMAESMVDDLASQKVCKKAASKEKMKVVKKADRMAWS